MMNNFRKNFTSTYLLQIQWHNFMKLGMMCPFRWEKYVPNPLQIKIAKSPQNFGTYFANFPTL